MIVLLLQCQLEDTCTVYILTVLAYSNYLHKYDRFIHGIAKQIIFIFIASRKTTIPQIHCIHFFTLCILILNHLHIVNLHKFILM